MNIKILIFRLKNSIKKYEDYILSIPLAILAGIVVSSMGSIFAGILAFTVVIYKTIPQYKSVFLIIGTLISIILMTLWIRIIYLYQPEDFTAMLMLYIGTTALLLLINILNNWDKIKQILENSKMKRLKIP